MRDNRNLDLYLIKLISKIYSDITHKDYDGEYMDEILRISDEIENVVERKIIDKFKTIINR